MFAKRLYLIVTIYFSIFSFSHPTHAQSWSQISTVGSVPTGRNFHTSIYDINNNRMSIFGGQSGLVYENDFWVFYNANGLNGISSYNQIAPNGTLPSVRANHSAVYDSVNNIMTIFGGYYRDTAGDAHFLNDVWVLSTANGLGGTPAWTQITTTGNIPSPRVGHTAIYDENNNMMTIFGGSDTTGNTLNDIWILSNANGFGGTPSWTQITTTGSAPAPRYVHTAVYDTTNNLMLIFGGIDSTLTDYNDVWVLSNANGLGGTPSWTQITTTGNVPSPRWGHSAIYDAAYNWMIIFGGAEESTFTEYNDSWILSNANGLGGTPTWTQITTESSSPSPRIGHSAVYDTANRRMIVFGGNSNDSNLNDAWVLNVGYSLPPPALSIPSLKLFINQDLNPAFDLAEYNSGGPAISYSVVSNFLGLTILNGSTVYQWHNSYNDATTGTNAYVAGNLWGASTASNEVKYSTYKINKLPHVGLTVGSSWDVNVGNYTYNSDGLAIPPSFGSPDALIVSDTTSISATWVGNTIVHITSLQSFSGVVNVDIIASPNANSPFGVDIDKERIQVYTNLQSNGTFSTAQDTTAYGIESFIYNYSALPTISWLSSYTDSAGVQANGVWAFNFSNPTTYTSVKVTPFYASYQTVVPGQWYIARMRITSDTPNNNLIVNFYTFTYPLVAGVAGDIAANNNYGIPTTWTWIETPILSHTTSNSAFLQFQLLDYYTTNANGNVYIDELQWIQAAPALTQARSNTQSHYLYGQFTASNDTTGWGQQLLYLGNFLNAPAVSVSTGLILNFSGASDTSTEGIKWTANNGVQGSGHAYTYPVTPGRDIGVRATATLESGDFNDLWILLFAAIGIQTSGQQDITPPCNIVASAQVGALTGGEYRAVGTAVDPYYQFQFAVRSNQEGVLVLNDIDFDTDNDDPNFGDPSLFQ